MYLTVVFLLITSTTVGLQRGAFALETSLAGINWIELPLTPVGGKLCGVITVDISKEEEDQELKVLVDTGSIYTWVVDSEAGRAVPGRHASINGRNCESYSRENNPLTLKYKEGQITGYLAKAKITLNTQPNQIVVEGQEFGVATRTSGVVFNNHDAILGLNLVSKKGVPGEPDLFVNKLPKNLQCFGFRLKKTSEPPVLLFGEGHEGFVEGQFTTHSVVKVGGEYNGWNVQIDKFMIAPEGDNDLTEIPVPVGQYGQLDSGYSGFMMGPNDVIDKINQGIFERSSHYLDPDMDYEFPSDEATLSAMTHDLPQLYIIINGEMLTFDLKAYLTLHRDGIYKTGIIGKKAAHFTFGQQFMTEYYTKFDYPAKTVSFAKSL